MVEIECTLEHTGAVLAGTLCLPSGTARVPCVLMLPASGPLDRDENYKGQQVNIFNAIAHHLASKGFASVRYDKRGCGKSTGDYFNAGYFDFVADAAAWYDWLQGHDRCATGQLYALGHSEGTLTAMHLSISRPTVAGIIQLCPSADTAETVLIKQAQHLQRALGALSGLRGMVYRLLLRDPVAGQRRRIERVKSGRMQPREAARLHLGLKWLVDLLQLDPRQMYGQMRRPMLVVAGAKDVQCDSTDLPSVLKAVACPVELHIVPNLTHVLRFDGLDPSVFHYPSLIRKPIEPEVLEIISQWIARQTRRAHGP
jgi:uncharacterized protein